MTIIMPQTNAENTLEIYARELYNRYLKQYTIGVEYNVKDWHGFLKSYISGRKNLRADCQEADAIDFLKEHHRIPSFIFESAIIGGDTNSGNAVKSYIKSTCDLLGKDRSSKADRTECLVILLDAVGRYCTRNVQQRCIDFYQDMVDKEKGS